MTKGRIAKYVANTALLAVLAAAGIGVYQLGTSGKDESVPEKVPSYYDESLSTENTTDNAVDAGTSLVEAELDSNISTDHTSEKGMSQTEGEDAGRLIYELTAKARKLPFLKGQEIVPVLFLKQKPLRESDALVITPQEIIDAIG